MLKISDKDLSEALCCWCIEPVSGNYVVSRHDKYRGVVSDYACDGCALGWQEIADPDKGLIV